MQRNHSLGWIVLLVGILAFILVPFTLFGEAIEVWTHNFLEVASNQTGKVALVLALLLGGDIVLPVPSSIASTAAGFVLGFLRGLLTSWVGMTVSCMLGFVLASKMGHPIASRLVGEKELARLANLERRFGNWVLIVARPVPVLAEASILFAGIARIPFGRFMLLTTLSNLGISAVYAAVGAFSSNLNSFLLAFFGAILIPGVAMWLMNRVAAPAAEEHYSDIGGSV
ncbi:MAG: VTT domain-containing protein [Anaerolineae bacterium]|nr:VTT domain-containing protein [Anaerolineae bacterium]